MLGWAGLNVCKMREADGLKTAPSDGQGRIAGLAYL
jgi:hypothetical protein